MGIINRGEKDNKNMKIMSNEDLDFEYDWKRIQIKSDSNNKYINKLFSII